MEERGKGEGESRVRQNKGEGVRYGEREDMGKI